MFWVARKKLRADAELACDAWAAGQADRRAYAEALLEVCSFNPRRRPAPAVGVFGEGRVRMQERLTMIMRDRVPCRLAFGAKLVVALMAVAAVPAWTLGQGKPGSGDAEIVLEVADRDGADDAQAKEIEAQIKALAQKLQALKAAKAAEAQKKAAEKVKEGQEKLGEKMKDFASSWATRTGTTAKVVGREVKVLVAGQDGVKVIGPDGKEIKDAKVIIGGSAQGGTHVVKPLTTGGAGQDQRVEVHVVGQDGKRGHGYPTRWTTTQPAGHHANVLLRDWECGRRRPRHHPIASHVQAVQGAGDRPEHPARVDQGDGHGDQGRRRFDHGDHDAGGPAVDRPDRPAHPGPERQRPLRVEGGAGPGPEPIRAQGGPAGDRPSPASRSSRPRPTSRARPTPARRRIDVNVILDQLKSAGGCKNVPGKIHIDGAGEVDMARLQEMLKTLKPLELKLKTEKLTGEKKPVDEKK